MASDCTALEAELRALNKEQLDESLHTTEEQRAADRLNDLASREDGLKAAVAGYGQLITSYDNGIRAIELPLETRIGEYEQGVKSLQSDRQKHVAELQRATTPADRGRVKNNIAMTDAAIREHQLGIQQMKDAMMNSTADLRSQREEAKRDLQSHEQQLSDLQSELGAGAQAVKDAAEAAKRAFERLQVLKSLVEDKQQQLAECRKKKEEEEAASTSSPVTGDPTRWFRP
jgi:chromosome segregation ATPase